MSRPVREEAEPIAVEVKRLADERGLSNSDLARIAEVSPQAVGSWFAKPVLITPAVLNVLEEEFGLRKGAILARCGYVDFESQTSVIGALEADRTIDGGQRRLLIELFKQFSEQD